MDDEFNLDFVNSANNPVLSKWTKGHIWKDKSKDLKDVTNMNCNEPQVSKKKKMISGINFTDGPIMTVKETIKSGDDEDD